MYFHVSDPFKLPLRESEVFKKKEMEAAIFHSTPLHCCKSWNSHFKVQRIQNSYLSILLCKWNFSKINILIEFMQFLKASDAISMPKIACKANVQIKLKGLLCGNRLKSASAINLIVERLRTNAKVSQSGWKIFHI